MSIQTELVPLLADFDNDGWKTCFISNGILRDITNLDFVKYTSGYTAGQEHKAGINFENCGNSSEDAFQTDGIYLFHHNHDLSLAIRPQNGAFTQKSNK